MLPANFFSRQELQKLILSILRLLPNTSDADLRSGLTTMLAGVACVEGTLAEISPTRHPTHRVLANPYQWRSRWQEMGGGRYHETQFEFQLWQQVLESGDIVLPTGRFRVKLGDTEYVSSDKQLLMNRTICYMSQYDKQIPRAVRDGYLDAFAQETDDAV